MTSPYLLRPLRTLKQAQLDAAIKCTVCGAMYTPKTSPTARSLPHCFPMALHNLKSLKGVYVAGVMGVSDYNKGTVK